MRWVGAGGEVLGSGHGGVMRTITSQDAKKQGLDEETEKEIEVFSSPLCPPL